MYWTCNSIWQRFTCIRFILILGGEGSKKSRKSADVVYEWSLSTNNDTDELQILLTHLSISSKVWVAQPILLIKYWKHWPIKTLNMIISIHPLFQFFSKSCVAKQKIFLLFYNSYKNSHLTIKGHLISKAIFHWFLKPTKIFTFFLP